MLEIRRASSQEENIIGRLEQELKLGVSEFWEGLSSLLKGF